MGVGEDVAVVVAHSSDVEEADEDALRARANDIVEISCDTLTAEHGGDVGPIDLGEDRGNRLDNNGSGLGTAKERQHAGTPWKS